MKKHKIKVIVVIVIVIFVFTGCYKHDEINMEHLYSDKVNFNNYSISNTVDFKQGKGVVCENMSFDDQLIVFDNGYKIDTMKSTSIQQCQICDSGVYYVSGDTLLFWNLNTKTHTAVVDQVNSFVLHDNMIVCSVYNNKLLLLNYNYDEIFSVEDILNYTLTNEFLYYTTFDDVLYRLSLMDFTKIDELVKLDIDRYPYNINVSNGKVIINQGTSFVIYDLENAKCETIQCTTPNISEQDYEYEIRSYICNDSQLYYCGYMNKYKGSFSFRAQSEFDGVYVIDLSSNVKEKISSNTYSELYNFGEDLFGIRDAVLYKININNGSEQQIYK